MDFVYRGRTVTLLRYYGRSLWTLFIAAELLRYYAITDALCGLCLSRPNCYTITLLWALFEDFIYHGRPITLLRYYGRSLWALFIAAELLRYYAITLLRTLFVDFVYRGRTDIPFLLGGGGEVFGVRERSRGGGSREG